MLKKLILTILIASILAIFLSVNHLFAETPAVEYMCDFGISLYKMGKYDDALTEFKKALIVDPGNATAQAYINEIFRKYEPGLVVAQEQASPKAPVSKPEKRLTRDEAMSSALNSLKKTGPGAEEEKPSIEIAGVKISGEAQARFGFTPEDAIWKRANWDLNEKNYRIMSNVAFDRKENTYDPRIYDRLRVKMDSGDDKVGFAMHGNVTVDPWSYVGKSNKFTVFGAGGQDAAAVELKYWSNTGYTINQTVNTLENGDSFNLNEIKVVDGHISTPVSVRSAFNNTFIIPETKIYRSFVPLREIWADYNNDTVKLRVYPLAYENQSKTFDDPLKLSNNRTWWEDSPWLRNWKHGNFNSGATPVDFTRGYWDNSLSFFTRDSEGQRLSSLRGASFDFSPQEGTSFQTNIAAPKTLWQDYAEVDNALAATRFKQSLGEKVTLGLTNTMRFGYNVDNKDKLDAKNFVGGVDLSYQVVEGIQSNFEVAYSKSEYDLTNAIYRTNKRGNAYNFSLLGRFPRQSILNTEYGYEGIRPEKEDSFFTKFRFFAARMDSNFDASLSSYVETRDDEWWSRHLHFRTPLKYYYQGEGQLMTWDDIKNYAIGNGIDIGRSVLGLRVESMFLDKKIYNLFDLRNVHASESHKFVENVVRDEFTWDMNDKLTSKGLWIYQRMPKTVAGVDPFIFDPNTRRYFLNDVIADGEDPSIQTGSLGLEYKFFDWVSLNGIWELTNDISLAYDNYPRGIFNTGSRSFISVDENGNTYRDILNALYSQGVFPKPPYPYYNIFKAGLKLSPMENLGIYLDYTRNPYEKAGQVDDNMNHVGLEVSYAPVPKLNFFFKYNYSRWQDLDKLLEGSTKLYSHHNVFFEMIYRMSQNEDFTLQYGEASRDPYSGGVLDIGWDPYGGSLRTIDTPHIFRLYYRRKF